MKNQELDQRGFIPLILLILAIIIGVIAYAYLRVLQVNK